MMKYYQSIIVYLLLMSFSGCAQENRNVSFFKGTAAYQLAVAVGTGDVDAIEGLVGQNTSLLGVTDPVSGSNVLALSVRVEQFESFKKLLEMGADPNFINPLTKHSVLIDAVKPFGSQLEWRLEPKYIELLLKHGANPNYAVEGGFTNQKQRHVGATSPLMKASKLDLGLVKLLVQNGADPHKRLGAKKLSPLGEALRASKFDIANYYIDTLNADVRQPMSIVVRQPDNQEVVYYIQDYAVNKFTKAKLMGDDAEVERLKQASGEIEQANQDRWEFIKKLESMGVDFKGYDYK